MSNEAKHSIIELFHATAKVALESHAEGELPLDKATELLSAAMVKAVETTVFELVKQENLQMAKPLVAIDNAQLASDIQNGRWSAHEAMTLGKPAALGLGSIAQRLIDSVDEKFLYGVEYGVLWLLYTAMQPTKDGSREQR